MSECLVGDAAVLIFRSFHVQLSTAVMVSACYNLRPSLRDSRPEPCTAEAGGCRREDLSSEPQRANGVCACLGRAFVGGLGGGRSTLHTSDFIRTILSSLDASIILLFFLSISLSGFTLSTRHPAWPHPHRPHQNFPSLAQHTTLTHRSQSTASSMRSSWICPGPWSLLAAEAVVDTILSRFILNLPDGELGSLERVCFQVEQALVQSSLAVDHVLSPFPPPDTGIMKTLSENKTQVCPR